MKNCLYYLFALLALSGCDAAINMAAEEVIKIEPTIEFEPGYKINVDGTAVSIAGFDVCSKDGKYDCVVLSKDRKVVAVQVALPTGLAVEQWAIIRETGKTESGRPYSRTSLRRPDGTLVIPATTS
jgi:hypothetical protein